VSDVRQLGDTDRLPWLEPFKEQGQRATTPGVPSGSVAGAKRSVSVPLWLIALLGAIAVAVAGYDNGRRASRPDAGASVTTELPQATLPYHSLEELANEEAPPPPPPANEVEKPTQAAPAATAIAPSARVTKPTPKPRPKAAPVRKPAPRAKAPPKRTTPARPKATQPARPRFVMRMSPPPVAGRPGQVIEIGRYTNPRIADAMWHRVIWRYPYLGRLSKTVIPTTTSRQRVYALRLGTGSRSHARTLCRNLTSIGYPCAVV
jgi:hypothetical protein